MKIKLILILLLLSTLIGNSQTFEIPRLVDFSPSECDEGADVYRLRTRVIDKWIKGDTLLVEVGTRATCCVEFIPSIELLHDTLNLSFEETGEPCECICCYQFIYHIVGLSDIDIPIKLQNTSIELSNEKYLTYPIMFKIIDGDTINYIDKYGLKQGYWYNKSDSSLSYMRAFAQNDRWKYRESVHYDDSAKISSIYINQGYYNSTGIQFYESGLVKRQTIDNKDFYQEIKFYPDGTLMSIRISGDKQYYQWKEFYPNGQLRKERYPTNDKSLWAVYYYDTGELMAEFYVFKESIGASPVHKWICYNKDGKNIDRVELINLGLLEK